ncbi:hypothetical protein MNBD_GAMMA25-1605 [hydrothermal vent metagenome]|uniref:Uncharacterized protein n=1 Tax=hydrothermal vent metagenome TaxID=652676 RepID=A0A3B1C3B0_9ZZZZ
MGELMIHINETLDTTSLMEIEDQMNHINGVCVTAIWQKTIYI